MSSAEQNAEKLILRERTEKKEKGIIKGHYFLVLLALAVIVVGAPSACTNLGQDGDDHSGSVTDGAAQDEDASIESDRSDTSSAQTDLEQRVSTDSAERDDRNVVSLVGALKGNPSEFN